MSRIDDSFPIGYIRKRPSPAEYREILDEMLGNKWRSIEKALRKHMAASDYTLSLTEICRAMKRPFNNAPYGLFAWNFVKKSRISNQTIVEDYGSGPYEGNLKLMSNDPRTRCATYALAGASVANGELQWTLYREVVDALRRMRIGPSADSRLGSRLPAWALRRFGFKSVEFPTSTGEESPGKEPSDLKNANPERGAAGFGEPESNKKIEKAAIAYVKKRYRDTGWTVRSVEGQQFGYDLICTRAKESCHVEVKGNQGSKIRFLISGNEVETAMSDPQWKIAVVIDALTRRREMREWTRDEFLHGFRRKAITYIAELAGKTNLHLRPH